MKPDKFDSKRVPLNTFLIQFETRSEYNGWSEKEKIAQLRCCLTGDAALFRRSVTFFGGAITEKLLKIANFNTEFHIIGQ